MAIIETATIFESNNTATATFNSVIIIKVDNQSDDENRQDDGRYHLFIVLSFFVVLILSVLLYQLYCKQSKSSYGCCRRLQKKLWWLSDYDDYHIQVARTNSYSDNEDDPCKTLLNAKLHINNCYENFTTSNPMNSTSVTFSQTAEDLRNIYSI